MPLPVRHHDQWERIDFGRCGGDFCRAWRRLNSTFNTVVVAERGDRGSLSGRCWHHYCFDWRRRGVAPPVGPKAEPLPAPLSRRLSVIAFDRLPALAQKLKPEWEQATPFAHVVVDDFLPKEHADRVVEGFDATTEGWIFHNHYNERKYAHSKKQFDASGRASAVFGSRVSSVAEIPGGRHRHQALARRRDARWQLRAPQESSGLLPQDSPGNRRAQRPQRLETAGQPAALSEQGLEARLGRRATAHRPQDHEVRERGDAVLQSARPVSHQPHCLSRQPEGAEIA